MADIAYDDVYIGPWVDQSEGAIRGAKITLTSTHGAILIAFLALFVQYVGQHLWEIACFGWHQLRSSPLPKLALQYQQDLALRNNGTPAQSLIYFARIAWAWRHARKQIRSSRYFRIAILPTGLPLIFVALLIASGILSSSLIDTTNISILLRGNNCGLWEIPTQEMLSDINNKFTIENGKYERRTAGFGSTYTRQCYNSTGAASSPSCQSFVKASIPVKTTLSSPCPFNSTTCQLDSTNINLDTGEIDTNDILGINSKSDNIKFRKSMTCAPINPEMFTEIHNYTLFDHQHNTSQEERIVWWMYGPFLLEDTNATAYANSIQATQLNYYTTDTIVRFLMDDSISLPDQSTFIPRDEFNRTDGDTQFIFLSGNRIIFSEPCDDPWFSAHQPYTIPNTTNFGGYLSDHLAVPMGCVEQYQFCNPHAQGSPCTPLTGIIPASANAYSTLELNAVQTKIVDLILNTVYAQMINIGLGFDPNAPDFLAYDSVVSAWQLPLPDNQWVQELQYANNKVLAMLQRLIVDFAQGPGSVEAQQFIVKPNTTDGQALCSMIRARTNGRYSNVSTYGLAITLILGCLIVIINTVLAPLLVHLRGRRGTGSYKTERWSADSLFQVQKHIFTRAPFDWEGESVPVTPYVDTIKRRDLSGACGTIGIEHGVAGPGRVGTQETVVEKGSPLVKTVQRMDSADTIAEYERTPVSPVSPVTPVARALP